LNELKGAGYDATVNVFPVTGLRPAMFVRKTGARTRVGTRLTNRKYRWMSGFFYTQLLEIPERTHGVDIGFAHLGVPAEGNDRQGVLRVPRRDRERARKYLLSKGLSPDSPVLGVHPGSHHTNPHKRWPLERFAVVAERMVRKKGHSVLFFVGPDEPDLAAPVKKIEREVDGVHLVKEARLDRAVPLVGACDIFLSNDSGLMHMASALGVPVLGIFGPTDPSRYSPSGPEDRYLHHELECSGCYGTPAMKECPERRCMESVTAGMVWDELASMTEENKSGGT
jgi:heptosyltransferase-2